MPVASNTSALNVSSWPATSGLKIPASLPAPAAALRTSSESGVRTSAPIAASTEATEPTSRASGAAPSSTGPSSTGRPGS
jgi:hypothetical protein